MLPTERNTEWRISRRSAFTTQQCRNKVKSFKLHNCLATVLEKVMAPNLEIASVGREPSASRGGGMIQKREAVHLNITLYFIVPRQGFRQNSFLALLECYAPISTRAERVL